MTFLITGGLGYIGSVLAEVSAQAGHRCFIVDRDQDKRHLPIGDKVILGDILHERKIVNLIKKYRPQVIHHLAALSNVAGYQDEAFSENVIGTCNILEAIRQYSPETLLVFASSCAVYGNNPSFCTEETSQSPVSAYGRSKMECEKVIHDYSERFGLGVVIFRYSNVAGATDEWGELRQTETHLLPNICLAARDRQPITLFGSGLATIDGSSVRDYVHVKDVANIHLSVSKEYRQWKKCREFNIGAGVSYSSLQMVEAVTSASGQMLEVKHAPCRAGDTVAVYIDNNRARQELGISLANSNLNNIVNSTYRWLSANKYRDWQLQAAS